MRHERGFTLLEVMVALAILAMSIVILLEIVTNNVRATNRSKLITTATFLARGKMVAMETQLLEDGFVDSNQEDAGTFEEEGFPRFSWTSAVEQIKLPSNLQPEKSDDPKKQVGQSEETAQDRLSGLLGGAAAGFMEPVRIGLEASIRRVTVAVTWDEVGRGEQSFEVVGFFTDAAKLNMSLPDMAARSAAGNAAKGATGGSSGSTKK